MKAKMVNVHSLYGACIFSVEAVSPEAILGKSFLRFASNLYVWSKRSPVRQAPYLAARAWLWWQGE